MLNRTWRPFDNNDKSHERTWQHVVKRDTRLELNHGLCGCRSFTKPWGCVFQGMKPPKPISRKSSDMRKPVQRLKLTKALTRHTKIRDQNPSLGLICPGGPHQRISNVPKFEDRSQEETKWQEQGAREEAGQKCVQILGA